MKPEELETLRLKLRLLVRTIALEELTSALRSTQSGAQVLQRWANLARERSQPLTMPGLDAAMSDLTAAEWQEALAEMLSELGL